jgi:hypothetical protein
MRQLFTKIGVSVCRRSIKCTYSPVARVCSSRVGTQVQASERGQGFAARNSVLRAEQAVAGCVHACEQCRALHAHRKCNLVVLPDVQVLSACRHALHT